MTQEHYRHPIAPPPELVQQWAHEWNTLGIRHPDATNTPSYVATRAAQWGADQELEACVKWLEWNHSDLLSRDLRAARRPKPPSLKEQALALIDGCSDPDNDYLDDDALATIRRALEQLDD